MENNNITIDEYKKILKKSIKNYIKGKKDNSIELLKQSLKSLNDLKNINKFDEYNILINQTETECNKYLKSSINKKNNSNKNIFDIICSGNIKDLNKLKINQIDFNILNEEGLTPLHYSIKMGDMKILKKLLKLGGKINQINGNGHTLLEYACLEKDPNAIQFIIMHGANMKKHLFLRDGVKYNIKNNDIDSAIILKLIILEKKENIDERFFFLYNHFDSNDKIGIENFIFDDILKGLTEIFKKIPSYYITTYINILKDELKYNFKNNICCPIKKTDIILFNLVPFTNYPFHISSEHILLSEIKYLISNVFKNNIDNINNKNSKKLINILFNNYINTNLFTSDYIGILTNQLISKINI